MRAPQAPAQREFSREELEKELLHDYSTSSTGVVPQGERRTLYHFLALWVTLAAGFTYLFLGFQYHDAGYPLAKAVGAGALGALCYLVYALPASYLGSRTGQTHSLLTRSIFGLVGSAIVSLLLIGVAAGWTAFAFNLLAVMYDGLFTWGHVVLIGVVLAVVGIFNNLFGFTGITAFARYLVAPVMIVWVLYLVIKGFTDIPGNVLSATPAVGDLGALPFLSGISLAIGSVMWGNEPDTWRYGKPRFFWPALPYVVALAVGLVLFVIGGWMMAQISGAGPFDFGPAFKATVKYSLFGALWLGAVVATFPHIENGFFKVAGWSAIALPCATVVMCVDQFLVPRALGLNRSVERIPEWRAAGLGNWPAIVAVVVSLLFGAWGLMLFPGQTSAPSLGLVPVEAWLLAGVVYLALAALAARAPNAKALLGFAQHLRPEPPEALVPAVPEPEPEPEPGVVG